MDGRQRAFVISLAVAASSLLIAFFASGLITGLILCFFFLGTFYIAKPIWKSKTDRGLKIALASLGKHRTMPA